MTNTICDMSIRFLTASSLKPLVIVLKTVLPPRPLMVSLMLRSGALTDATEIYFGLEPIP